MTTFTNITSAGKKLSFTINDAELSVINAIRRIVLSEIPTVAFYFDAIDIEHNDITIYKNTCALHNEFLAHRISLVPLCFNENDINEFDVSKYRFVLKKDNTTYELMSITTNDFDILDDEGNKYPSSLKEKVLPKNRITNDHILLTKLKPNLYDETSPPRGEGLHIECVPSLGTGAKHARWNPASQCTFGNTIDQDAADAAFEEYLKRHEAEVGRKASAEERELQRKRFNTLEMFRCFKKNKYDEANTFDFKLESECGLRPAYLVFKACKILIEKVQKFADNLSNKNSDEVNVTKLSGVEDYFMIEVKHENYTLVNLLQSMIYNICFRETKPALNPVDYIGYTQPHPLDDLMVIKIKLRKVDDGSDVSVEQVISTMTGFTDNIINKLKLFMKEWLAVSMQDIKDVREVIEYKDTL